jgi:hypothetical protein
MSGPELPVPSQQLTSRRVTECTSEEVTAAIVHCFEGYVVPMRFSPEKYEARFRAENLDPFASRLYYGSEAVFQGFTRASTAQEPGPLHLRYYRSAG